MHSNKSFWFEPILVICLNLCFLGWGDDATKIYITKSSQWWREITENEQMKLSSYNPASSKYNIQDNTKN